MLLENPKENSSPLTPALILLRKKATFNPIAFIGVLLILLPILFLLLLPGVIFDGYTDGNSLNDGEKVLGNLAQINRDITDIMHVSYTACLEQVEQKRLSDDYSEVIDLVQDKISYQGHAILSQYCAAQNKDFSQISLDNLLQTVTAHSDQLYTYTVHHENRIIGSGTDAHNVTVAVYTIRYIGDDYWADEIFALTEEEKAVASDYALNLGIFLAEHKTASANKAHQSLKDMLKDDALPFVGGTWGSPFPDTNWSTHVSSPFGQRPTPGGKGGVNNHTGLDIALPKGTAIHALNDGVVLYTHFWNTSYGYHVAINHHGGYVTLYAHCSELLVSPGQSVHKGDVIAKVGSTGNSTGNHCHVEIIKDGQPLDPALYLPRS